MLISLDLDKFLSIWAITAVKKFLSESFENPLQKPACKQGKHFVLKINCSWENTVLCHNFVCTVYDNPDNPDNPVLFISNADTQ